MWQISVFPQTRPLNPYNLFLYTFCRLPLTFHSYTILVVYFQNRYTMSRFLIVSKAGLFVSSEIESTRERRTIGEKSAKIVVYNVSLSQYIGIMGTTREKRPSASFPTIQPPPIQERGHFPDKVHLSTLADHSRCIESFRDRKDGFTASRHG